MNDRPSGHLGERISLAVKIWLDSRDLNHSALVRGLIRQGHPRELRAHALEGRGPRARMEGAFVRWLEAGRLRVHTGRAAALQLALSDLPISHPHLGAIAFGTLETSVQEAMVRHLGTGGVLYDIGANIGFFSLLGARLVGPEPGQVYAFEPGPESAHAIQVNAQLNGVQNITVIPKAVGASAHRGRLQLVSSDSRLEEYGAPPRTEQVIEVDVVAIDDLVGSGKLQPPTVVKIDVEGAELAVLEGMRRTVAEYRPAIICELHGTHREFVAAMAELGYRTVNLEGPWPVEQGKHILHALGLPAGEPGD